MIRKRLLRQMIEPAGQCVFFNLSIPVALAQFIEPAGKATQIVRLKGFYIPFNFFKLGHEGIIFPKFAIGNNRPALRLNAKQRTARLGITLATA